MGMAEVEEDLFACLACQAQHFQAIYSSRLALLVHMGKSENPKRLQEWSKIKVIVCSGNVIAGGACGMGPCPAQQHQPQRQVTCGVYIHNILCIFSTYTMYM
jgi:hypothetical protein